MDNNFHFVFKGDLFDDFGEIPLSVFRDVAHISLAQINYRLLSINQIWNKCLVHARQRQASASLCVPILTERHQARTSQRPTRASHMPTLSSHQQDTAGS